MTQSARIWLIQQDTRRRSNNKEEVANSFDILLTTEKSWGVVATEDRGWDHTEKVSGTLPLFPRGIIWRKLWTGKEVNLYSWWLFLVSGLESFAAAEEGRGSPELGEKEVNMTRTVTIPYWNTRELWARVVFNKYKKIEAMRLTRDADMITTCHKF